MLRKASPKAFKRSRRTPILYNMSEFYHPESGRGIRWNDPALAITWSISNPVISTKNAASHRSMQRFDGEGGA